jgi:hypothetical protein
MMLQAGTRKQDRKVLGDLEIDGTNVEEDPRSIFVGHGIITDLKVLDLQHTLYQCTQVIDQTPNTRKLKDLASKHLNALIQQGHHSSIIDARSSLALFLMLKEELGLETRGPIEYISNSLHTGLSSYKRQRAGKRAQKKRHFPPSQILDHT